jgi:L-ascorbate metabolism protein UlaG (beta-lactamase superfamily)
MKTMNATYIGGPTAIIELGGFRFITDPTFDPAGSHYSLAGGKVNLEKLQSPSDVNIGKIDFVLLSHDQHPDNLDNAGRKLLVEAAYTITTKAGSKRLGGTSIGLDPWETYSVTTPDGSVITITATPARHGPAGIEPISGDVIGFVLSMKGQSNHEIYITGDTVYYEGVAAVAKKFKPELIFLFAGAARTRGPFNLTMSTNDAIDTAFAFPSATIIPLHYEGWKHFTQNESDLEKAFEALGIRDRLKVLKAGEPVNLFKEIKSSYSAAGEIQ